MAKFRKVELSIIRAGGYGQYTVRAFYRGLFVVAHTTDSECFLYLEDDSNKKKHLEAKRHAYSKIVSIYNKR